MYFAFNTSIFLQITKISNLCYGIIDLLTRNISYKYINLFIELENKQNSSFIEKYLKSPLGLNSESNFYKNNINNISIEEIIKSKLESINLLCLEMCSIFGFNNFTLNSIYPWYNIASYGGTFISSLIALYTLNKISLTNILFPLALIKGSLFSVIAFGFTFIVSYKLKSKFENDSKQAYIENTKLLIQFLAKKKDKLLNFGNQYKKFCQVYSKESLELLNLFLNFN